jgi:glutamine amidotransferase
MIAIVDYGMGNIGSIANMLRKVGASATLTGDPEVLGQASKIILPGVGAFDNGMANLEASGLVPLLNRKALEERVPVLGICLGMQLLSRSSEEGRRPGLGWIAADTKRFQLDSTFKVPHMGWNYVQPAKASPLTAGLPEHSRFYFVHSYHVVCDEPSDVLLASRYGIDITAAVQRDNVMGVQFHPEKSHTFGMQLLKNFAEL